MYDKKPLISVEDLKLLIYKESGYRMQIRDNDPLLSVIYTNLAVLGKALETAATINQEATAAIRQLPEVADKEVDRARHHAVEQMAESIDGLARKAGEIALEIAGTAAETARLEAGWFASLSMSLFGALMIALGAYLGDNRAAWGSSVVMGVCLALGVIAGAFMGHRISVTVREKQVAHSRAKAYFKDAERLKWKESLENEMRRK